MIRSILLSLFFVFCVNINSTFAQSRLEDSLALVEFYDSTNGNSWTNHTNWKTGNLDTWYGVTVIGGRVSYLLLNNNNLAGILPSSIGSLTNLTWLSLIGNQLTGSIPPEIGNLKNLEILDIETNQLTGSIPTEICSLTSLENLALAGNQLTGPIPPEIGNLTNLTFIYLGTNQLTGPIPTEICSLTNLMYLTLGYNQLTDTVPSGIGNLTNLTVLALGNNHFTGSIPTQISNLTNLFWLGLNNNEFTDLPPLSALSVLDELRIQDNKFTFEDIEPNVGVASDVFIYSPQDSVGQSIDTTLFEGLTLTFAVSVGGDSNRYQWKKDEIPIPSATDTFYTISSATTGDAGSYICEITNTIATELTLYSRAVNITVIDTIPPDTPQNLSATPDTQQITLLWTPNIESDLHKYNIYRDTTSPATTLIDSMVASSSPPDTFYVDTSLTYGQEYFYRITAVDSSNNESDFSNEASAIPIKPLPQVVSVSPVQNALNISKSTNISVTFNTDMKDSTIGDSTFIVHSLQTGLHTGTYSYDTVATTATFNPDNNFAVGEIVSIFLTTDIEDVTGDTLTNPYAWSFTVEVDGGTGEFAPKVDYGTAASPRAVFSSDLDNDGYMDLAAATWDFDSVSVLLNNGDGTFATKESYYTGGSPNAIFSSDLDSDGNMDLAVVNRDPQNVSVLLNNGDGTFGSKADYGVRSVPCSVFSSDLDSDGDMDLVVTNNNSSCSVLINNGDGTFASEVSYYTGTSPSSSFATDLDSDGDMDLAVTDDYDDKVSILLNNGDGTFAEEVDYNVANNPLSVFASDLDSDGDMDLATANYYSNTISVLMNNGDGTFATRVDYAVDGRACSIFSSDLDSDSDMDLAVAITNSETVSIFLNNGNGTFAPNVYYGEDLAPYAIFSSDLDSDGDMDLVVPNERSNAVSVLFNNNSSVVPTPDLPETYSMCVKAISIDNKLEVRYTLPEKANNIRFAIYDIAGQKIKEEKINESPAGFYSLDINMKGVSKGVYFIRMEADGNKFVKTNKFVLM